MVLVVAITGSTGVIYGIRLLEALRSLKIETHLIISPNGEITIKYETDRSVSEVRSLASFSYRADDMAARISSGSFKTDGMIVAPCTVKTLSALASSYTDNLIIRAGDVTLKERRKLVLVVRETPLHLGHIRNMERVAEMGAIILPPVPAFYTRPQKLSDIVDYTVGKILDAFGIEHDLFPRWDGISGQGSK